MIVHKMSFCEGFLQSVCKGPLLHWEAVSEVLFSPFQLKTGPLFLSFFFFNTSYILNKLDYLGVVPSEFL